MIYIQTENGLTQVSPSLTKEKIIAALGYTPADKTSFYEDESGALLIADEKGYVIARIDENGMTTTQLSAGAIALNGEDLATKLKALEEATPDIDLTGYYTSTEVDNKIKEATDGLASESDIPSLEGYAKMTDIPSLEGYAKTTDIPEVPDVTAYDTHVSDEAIHVTEDQKTAWTNKSDFSGAYKDLEGAPNIVNDNEDEVVICDSAGNVILRATAEGLNVAAVYVNGVRVDEPVMKFKVGTKVLEMTPSTQLWSEWLNSSFNNGIMTANGNSVNYNMITGQDLHDVTIDDYIIPGYTYTYDDYS